MTPFDRLVAARFDSSELSEFVRELEHELRTSTTAGEVVPAMVPGPQQTGFYLSHELSRKDAEIRYVANWSDPHVGTGTCILRIRVGPLREGDHVEAVTELGPVIGLREYFEGADLYAVRDAGVRLSWPAACWLYGAAHATLVAIHHRNGKRHGKLRPERIRFGLLRRDNDGDPFDVASPFYFPADDWASELDAHGPHATDAERAAELATLAFAVSELTTHPDPTIDRLIHEPVAHPVLADRLLERGAPVELLLHDLLANPELEIGAYPEAATIDEELAALWRTVIELEPMIDKTRPGLWDLRRIGARERAE